MNFFIIFTNKNDTVETKLLVGIGFDLVSATSFDNGILDRNLISRFHRFELKHHGNHTFH
jgi:hypothetical protein